MTAYQDEDIICRCAGQILIADKCSVAKTGCDDNMSVAKSAAISLSVKNIFRGRIDWLIEKGQTCTTLFIFIPDFFIV